MDCEPWPIAKRIAFGVIGLALGGVFLYLALRNMSRQDFDAVLERFNRGWLAAGVALYMAAIALRCLRWGILLRTNGMVVAPRRRGASCGLCGELSVARADRRVVSRRLCHAAVLDEPLHLARHHFCRTGVRRHYSRLCAVGLPLAFSSFGARKSESPPLPGRRSRGHDGVSVVFGLALLFALLSGRVDLRAI